MSNRRLSPKPEMESLLLEMVRRQASDLHIVSGYRPSFRVHGEISESGSEPLDDEHARGMIESVLPEEVRAHLHHAKNVDCSLMLSAPDV